MEYNTHHFRGDPYEAGYSVGRLAGAQLGKLSERLIETWPARDGIVDQAKMNKGALPWIERLPDRYRQELCGLADGSGVPLVKIAEGYFAEECCCSSFITTLDDSHAWVGRNNDAWAPELWHGVTVHEIAGRKARIGFGIEAETFTTTGINSDRLWLHCNGSPAVDAPSGMKPCFYPYIIVTEALETCSTLEDVESLLERWERTRGMILFVVDGKSEESAIFECQCCEHQRRPTPKGPLIAANHSYKVELQKNSKGNNPEHGLERSISRCKRMEELFSELPDIKSSRELQCILAAEGVEQRYPDRVTVFSTVACPATGEMWFACGEGPAASTGTWSLVPWPW